MGRLMILIAKIYIDKIYLSYTKDDLTLMKKQILLSIFIISLLNFNCKEGENHSENVSIESDNNPIREIDYSDNRNLIKTRIKTPPRYTRSPEIENSFQAYLRNLKLKPEGSLVRYYNGSTKPNNNIYEAVVDLKIGHKDLHQCADAVMRLRAEYLWEQEQYDKINFNFTNGHKVEYKEWMSGQRMNIKGNKTWWSQETTASNTYDDFWNYMELIFMYAGTASLEKELKSKDIDDAEVGDILIQGGHPGHAVIIVDKAIHNNTKESIYLLAQSYMPAQEIHILKNPIDSQLSPWYTLDHNEVKTPEWTFSKNHLRQFDH